MTQRKRYWEMDCPGAPEERPGSIRGLRSDDLYVLAVLRVNQRADDGEILAWPAVEGEQGVVHRPVGAARQECHVVGAFAAVDSDIQAARFGCEAGHVHADIDEVVASAAQECDV